MSLTEIRGKVQHVSDVWRSDTAGEQLADLAELDDLLADLNDLESETPAGVEVIDELRGRIEILIDEIDISLGIEPAPIPGLADVVTGGVDEEFPSPADD